MSAQQDKDARRDEAGGLTDRLLDSRTVIISAAVDQELASKVITQLVLLQHADPKKPVHILINCPGGEVFSGFAIYDMIKFVTMPVYTVVVGLAASMGSIIPLASDKDKRYCLPHAKYLIHQPLLMGYQGRATDLEIQAREILKDRDRIIKLYSELTGKDAKQISLDIDRDKWLTAEEAQDYGLVQHIVASQAELPRS